MCILGRKSGSLVNFTVLSIILFVCSIGNVFAQTDDEKIVIDGTLHDPSQILKLLEQSPLIYLIDEYKPDSMEMAKAETEVLSDQLFTRTTDGQTDLLQYSMADSCLQILKQGEAFYADNDLPNALLAYESVAGCEPQYHKIWTLIGDVYFSLNQDDSAIYYFKKAIDSNFVDYQAHWFLADTYWRSGKKEEAVREMTIAHLLNVNHTDIWSVLEYYRNESGRPCNKWSFDPRYEIKASNDTIHVYAASGWISYALVMALWEYEPGYTEKMTGSENPESLISTLKEKEAVLCYLAENIDNKDENWGRIEQIIKDDLLNSFIIYEIWLKDLPAVSLLISPDSFMSLVDYFDRYH